MTERQDEVERLKTLLDQKEKEIDLLREKIQACQVPNPLTPESINNSSVPNYFKYCTGFTYSDFNELYELYAHFSEYQTMTQPHKHTSP